MFVSNRRLILKTCGTTTPLQCLEPLLQLAFDLGGYSEIEDLFYSRKNYKKPELQVSPHRGFEEEVAFLDQFFDDGRAYCLGSVNRDCWYLYTLSRRGVGEALANDLAISNNMIIESLQVPDPDQTIEVLMTDLDPKVMAIFTKEDSTNAKEATQVSQTPKLITHFTIIALHNRPQKSGINKIIPGMVIDDCLFEPCGYSMNGVSKNVSVLANISDSISRYVFLVKKPMQLE